MFLKRKPPEVCLEKAPLSLQEDMSKDGMAGTVLNGMNLRHIPSTGLAATPENANGVPFNASHVYASGNIAADMYANVAAEATGRALATRLYNMTDDSGMKDMLGFMIARDTMHQQQWLAVLEELGGYEQNLPIPNSFPQGQENQKFSYAFFVHNKEAPIPEGRWTQGTSLDGKGQYEAMISELLGGEPQLAKPRSDSGAQTDQMGLGSSVAAAANDLLSGGGKGAA